MFDLASVQLSEPFKIFEFDFWKRPDSHGEAEILIKAAAGGSVNAVISWYSISESRSFDLFLWSLIIIACTSFRWVLQLDREGTVFYSTAPKWIKHLQTEFPGTFIIRLFW